MNNAPINTTLLQLYMIAIIENELKNIPTVTITFNCQSNN